MTRLRWQVPLISVVILATAVSSWAGVFVSVAVGPPALPVYVQPVAPGPGYIWKPGYWAWGPDGYYWVPGTWVLPPEVGFLWTPGYWGFSAGLYNWHPGFWGPTVGFYGGINYGFGYPGHGYYGGYWRGHQHCSQRVQPDCRQQRQCKPRQLQRRSAWDPGASYIRATGCRARTTPCRHTCPGTTRAASPQ